MVYYLETVVGREAFDKFIPHYFTKWSGKSLDSWEFRDTYMDFFNDNGDEGIKKKIAEIDWEDRLLSQGLPPKPKFDTSLADECYSLAEKWETESFDPSPDDVKSFNANQKIVFLDALTQGKPLSAPRARQLGKVYELSSSQNVELKSAFYQIAIKARDDTSYAGAAELLGQVGRMKYVRPLFRGLNKVDRQLALDTFEKNKEFYHPICKGMVAKDLGIKV
jgi:leukotriene-A4 hydrolase